jgi:amidohydrolase
MTDLPRTISEGLPGLVAFRRDLHMHPEIAYEEVRTATRIREELAAAGIPFVAGLAGGTGTVAHLPGRDGSATVALRADIDALPIVEESGRPWASRTAGRMHACGHDGHTAILLGAARTLARMARENPLPRPVTFLFQPAEEGGGGARKMVDEGCLDGSRIGPPVRSVYGLHGWPGFALGTAGTRSGPLFASSDRFEIEIRGVGTHAAWPHLGRDPVLAAALVTVALQSIVAREVDPLEAAVVSVTRIHAGTAFNVIPPVAHLGGTSRALDESVRRTLERRIGEVAAGVAAGLGCTAATSYHDGYPIVRNDPHAVAAFDRIAAATLGPERLRPVERPVMGGEDFAFYLERVPGCMFALGLLPPGQESMPALHHPAFDFNDDAIATGVELFCRLALDPAA